MDDVATTRRAPLARLARLAARIGLGFVALVMAFFAVVGAGAAVGRFHVVAVGSTASNVHIDHDAAAILVPESRLQLHEGDVVAIKVGSDRSERLYRIAVVDSWTQSVYTTDAKGKLQELHGVPDTVGRVAHVIPAIGRPYRLVAGTPQGIALLLLAAFLLAKSWLQRRLRTLEIKHRSIGGPWWWTRFGAATVSLLGVLSLTASASFTATATVTQGAISAGHMGFTLPAAGSTYRLQTGITAMAPNDWAERPVDLQIDATTTSGMIQKAQLTISASSDTAGAGGGSYMLDDSTASSLRVFIQSCSQAWTESGSTPGYTYTCGGSRADVLGTYGAATALPTAGTTTCPPTGAVSVNATEVATDLTNITLTASSHNYLVVFLCLPNATSDNYQDASLALSWAFTGVQRAGTNK